MPYRLLQAFPAQWEDANGEPLVGGTLEFQNWNTSAPVALYTDSAGTSLGTSCTLNSLGLPQTSGGTACQLFGDTALAAGYKIIRKNAAGETIAPTLGPIFPSAISGDVQGIADSTLIVHDLDGTETTVAERLNSLSAARILVTDPRLGIATDGTVATTAMQAAINAYGTIEIPQDVTVVSAALTIPSNRTLIIDGTLRLAAAQAAGTSLLSNADQVGGNTNIRIVGAGTIDGNKANQSGTGNVVWHNLVDIENCSDVEFSVANVTGNYFPLATASANTTGAIYFRSCDRAKVHDSHATNYGREAFWCQNCDDSEMYNLSAIGGADSWSGVQFSGDYNKAYNLKSVDAGASGLSFDCRYSTLEGVVVRDNLFQHAINFGHAGIPADGSTAKNLISINSPSVGIQVAASTNGLTIDGFYVTGAAGNGIHVSDSSANIRLANGISTGNTGYGLGVYFAAATNAPLIEVDNVDLRGNTAGTFTRTAGAVAERFRNVRMSNDAMQGAQDIAGLGVGGTVTVTNANVLSTSTIVMQASNNAGMVAQPLLRTINDGSFVIETVASGGGGAFSRWSIL
jgi:hypothetical protein